MNIRYSPESLIKNTAYEIGFSDVGIADVEPSRQSDDAFGRWIDHGNHGEMRYLSGGSDKRYEPGILLEGARSVICVALNYYSESFAAANEARLLAGQGVFSVYAHGKDYHIVISDMLHELKRRLSDFFPAFRAAVCVDTQPISERDFAIRSGIAWLGKNTCVISPDYGSWIFLGELITNLDLESDQPLESLCGSCTKCVDACPTGALDGAFGLDSRKCISYLTIEKRGEIPSEFHEPIGSNIFGCDECQQVCPFNAVAQEGQVFSKYAQNPLVEMRLTDLVRLSDTDFRKHTGDSALQRCKADGLRRNARIVQRNLVASSPQP